MTFSQLHFIIREAISEVLYKYVGHAGILNMNPIVEMSKLNSRDRGAVPFPSDKFIIRIWSNDHNPPHFHVVAEGWDISFLIENGEVYRTNKVGKSSSMYNYIIKNIPKWLQMRHIGSKDTNQVFAYNIWDSYNDNKKF